jgi:GT2 family glycosyltransferase
LTTLVSVIVLNYNGRNNLGEKLLSDCLSSVLDSDYDDLELIFYDNGSTDESVRFVSDRFSSQGNLKIVADPRNLGFAKGNNRAYEQTRGEYVVLLNSDVIVKADWIKELIKVMNDDLTIGVAQCKILSLDRTHIQTAGNLTDRSMQVYLIGKDAPDKGQYDRPCEITFACGAAFITRRSLIERIGLFDPDYFWYHDDVDFSWRARLAGFKVVTVPSAIVYHKGSGTSKQSFRTGQGWFYFLTSNFGLFVKNFTTRSYLTCGTKFLVSNLMDITGLLLQRDSKTPLRFLLWIFKNFRSNWKKHLDVQTRIRKVSDKEVFRTFLDSTIFFLRIERYFDRLVGGRLYRDFEKVVSQETSAYYGDHLYNIEPVN